MDFSHYNDLPVQLAVDLVNTFNVVSGEEKLGTPSDVVEFITTRDTDWNQQDWGTGENDLKEVRALRSRLRAVFGAKDEVEASHQLNAILKDAEAVPRLSLHGEGPHLHFESNNDSPARWLGVVAAMGLTVAIVEGGYERFGTCGSSTCDDAFVDTSRNRSRRNCSDTCTTRENVAAHRARQREES